LRPQSPVAEVDPRNRGSERDPRHRVQDRSVITERGPKDEYPVGREVGRGRWIGEIGWERSRHEIVRLASDVERGLKIAEEAEAPGAGASHPLLTVVKIWLHPLGMGKGVCSNTLCTVRTECLKRPIMPIYNRCDSIPFASFLATTSPMSDTGPPISPLRCHVVPRSGGTPAPPTRKFTATWTFTTNIATKRMSLPARTLEDCNLVRLTCGPRRRRPSTWTTTWATVEALRYSPTTTPCRGRI
jgi:hypothetical protein